MNDTVKSIVIYSLFLVVGYSVGRYAQPEKTVEKEVIKYVDRIVEIKEEDKTENKKKHKTYIKLVTIKPDGTKTIETRIVEDDEVITIDHTKDVKHEDTTTTIDKEVSVVYSNKQYFISLGVENPFSDRSYGISVNKQFIGPLYLGGFVYTNRNFGLSVGLTF